jgi:hypothetical protein
MLLMRFLLVLPIVLMMMSSLLLPLALQPPHLSVALTRLLLLGWDLSPKLVLLLVLTWMHAEMPKCLQ